MLPASLLVQHQALIDAVIGTIARRHHLSADDRDEFAGHTRLRLLEDNEAILKKFEGRSSLRTYLVTVIGRLFLDYRVANWGRWRPSAQARRLGPTAIELERLTVRDGRSYDEAESMLRTNHQVPETAKELADLYAQLPHQPRRKFVDDGALAGMASPAGDGDQRLTEQEHRKHAARTMETLNRVMAELPDQDRLILQLRYKDGLTVATIARMLGLDQKPLYRRLETLLKSLKVRLEAEGITAAEVIEWLGNPAVTSEEDDDPPSGERDDARPSV